MHVTMYWEEKPDLENIRYALNSDYHYEDPRYQEALFSHTPLLQEPPEDLDETWRHGVFLNGGGVNEYLQLARSYRQSAEALLDAAIQSGEARDWGYPVLFAYRHALELYLKLVGNIKDPIHSLESCVHRIEHQLGKRIGAPMRGWIIELDNIDPHGTAFRYASDTADTLTFAEYWVDFHQLRFAMGRVFDVIDRACPKR
jgi:hypothetical protein